MAKSVEPSAIASRLPTGLPESVRTALVDFCESATAAFGAHLQAIVLFGSAAEGKLRVTSDVNVLVVLDAFDQQLADPHRESARLSYAAVRLDAMYVLAAEIPLAAAAFSVKFQDMLTRRVLLAGVDPLVGLAISPERVRERLRQVLLNTQLRLRAAYVTRSLREEQLAVVIAEAAAPIRSCAAAILALEGRTASSPKTALQMVCSELSDSWIDVLAGFSDARGDARLKPGMGPPLMFRLMGLCAVLRDRVDRGDRGG